MRMFLLLAAAAAVGIYLIVTASLIAKDGVTFIGYARGLEESPKQTMLEEYQHPGYPFLVLAAHKASGLFGARQSPESWAYAAQFTALAFRLASIAVFYFLVKRIVGASDGFIATLVLAMLPELAEYGSDALSDWPHFFFLAMGMLLLANGVFQRRWLRVSLVGPLAGAGYLVRPECAQLLIYCGAWFLWQLFSRKRVIAGNRAVFGTIVLIVGFFVLAGPYMVLKQGVLPKKDLDFHAGADGLERIQIEQRACRGPCLEAGFDGHGMAGALGTLAGNLGRTLMWVFVPAAVLGMYDFWKKAKGRAGALFIAGMFVGLNVMVLTWLYCRHDYISLRHSMPLAAFTVLFVPAGMRGISRELAVFLARRRGQMPKAENIRFWFTVLMIAAAVPCMVRVSVPIRWKKQHYRQAARWLSHNSDTRATIAAHEPRISFYAGRNWISYDAGEPPEAADYVVKILKGNQGVPEVEGFKAAKTFGLDQPDSRKAAVVVYARAE